MTEDGYRVERSTTIDAPAEKIYAQIADFHRWTAWSPWEDTDPDLRRTYTGADSGPGAVYSWSGNRRAGQGRMEIVDVTEPSEVRIDVLFEKPFRSRSESRFAITPDGPATRVTWTMTGRKTRLTRMMSVFTSMDKLIGPDFAKGLERLKATTESGR